MKAILAGAVLLGILSPVPVVAPEEGWVTDWEAAKKQAKKQGKDLLVDFTGSDWCTWCIKLHQEVFDEAEFQKAAPKDFVLVELDFPRKKLPAALKEQNDRLKDQFAIAGYPTIYLCDADGRPYAKTGYQAGGPEKYLEHLATLRKNRTARDEAFTLAKQSQGAAAAKLYAQGIDALPQECRHHYVAEIEQIVALDGDDAAGLKTRFEGMKTEFAVAAEMRKVEAEYTAAMQAKKPEKAAKLLGDFLQQRKPTGEVGHRGHFYHGMALQQADKHAEAVAAFEAALAAAPNGRFARPIEAALAKSRKKAGKSG